MDILRLQTGFTLIEIMITMAVVSIMLVGVMLGNTVIQQSSMAAFERTRATNVAHQVIEGIRKTAESGDFPQNVLDEYPDGEEVEGTTSYNNQAVVTVSYADSNSESGLENDSFLDVTVGVTWLENGRREASTSLRAMVIQR